MKSFFNKVYKKTIGIYIERYKWRKRNTHNYTRIGNYFDFNKVLVGKETYGQLNVIEYGNENEMLEIGNFCSIANNVTFILGGEHSYKKMLIFPIEAYYLKKNESKIKGSIIVEDDVWIGYGVTILSGVHIGKGAVIGAKSVVVKDVPEFSIVVGSPAKIIKYRFSQDIIDILHNFDYNSLNQNYIMNNLSNFQREIDSIEDLNWIFEESKKDEIY